MRINYPCIITPRLLPGIKIDDSFLSIEYNKTLESGRQSYTIYLDTPDFEYSDGETQSGIFGGSLKEGLSTCLCFMCSCGESVKYGLRTGRSSDSSTIYPPHVASWCAENQNELTMLQCEIEENANCIFEG